MERSPALAAGVAWCRASADEVRDRIARLFLGTRRAEAELGSVTLHPHQVSAVHRLEAALEQFNGALLCDEVGMGKTYVALAICRKYRGCLLVIPAALTSMWRAALTATGVRAAVVTIESLSRSDVDDWRKRAGIGAHDLVVIDEAHHVRNPRTNRYFGLESLVRGARVLLLSATPIHNRRADLVALLSLFLGSRARGMTSAELALCVVRREQSRLRYSIHIPPVLPLIHHDLPDDPPLVRQLMNLPPPVPPRDGGVAASLVACGLVQIWASSEAALHATIKRRIARAVALCASLEAGTYPSARELETWVYGEDAVQLGFAELLSSPSPAPAHGELLDSMRAHLAALENLRIGFHGTGAVDSERVRIISAIRNENPAAKIVAFAQYAETVSMLFRRLASQGGLAMLTSHGARVAGGALTRSEAIARFAPDASGTRKAGRAEVVDVLLTTDLLSEGVNLQDAQIVVHLDIPWTAARMEQRVGRVARLGSRHDHVIVHVLRPPPSAAELLAAETIVARKWSLAKSVVGIGSPNPVVGPVPAENALEPEPASPPARLEALRAILEGWIAARPAHGCSVADDVDKALVATVVSGEPGFLAALSRHGTARLLVAIADRVAADLASQIARCERSDGGEIETSARDVVAAVSVIRDWCRKEIAAATAGLGESTALRRREIIGRIDALIESAPPHLRAVRLANAARARAVATSQQCAAVERELETLLISDLQPDAWLAAVGDLGAWQTDARGADLSGDSYRIRALIIFAVRPRRSRPPRDPESP